MLLLMMMDDDEGCWMMVMVMLWRLPAETRRQPSFQLFQAALNGLFLAASRCSSCRWAPLFLAASRGQIGGHGDARRRWSSRLSPRDAPRRTLVRFASRSSHLRLARTWMRNGRTRLRTIGGVPLPSLLTRPPGLGRRRRRIYSGPSITITSGNSGTGRILRSGRAIAHRQ